MRPRSFLALLALAPLGLAASGHAAIPGWVAIGPQGGPASAIAVAGHFAVAATAGGLVASRDGGRTWRTLDAAPARPYTVAIAPHDPRHLWVAALDPSTNDYGSGGIYESRDQGATWGDRRAGLTAADGSLRFTYAFAFLPDDTPLIATTEGVMRLANRWQDVSLRGDTIWSLASRPGTDTLLAGAYQPPFPPPSDPQAPHGILRSEDGGVTWNAVETTAVPGRFVFDPVHSGRVLAMDASPRQGRLLRSEDGGATWTRLPGLGDATDVAVLSDGTYLATTAHGVVRSRDAGSTWRRVALASVALASLATSGSANVLVTGDAGIWRSQDAAATFRAASAGWSHQAIASLTADTAGAVLAGGSGVFRTTSGGAHWTLTIPPQAFVAPLVAAAAEAGRFYGASLADGRLGRSRDSGRTWEPGAFVDFGAAGLTVDPNDAETVYVSEKEQNGRDLSSCTLKSTDGGDHFACLTAPWADNYGHRLFTDEVVVRPGDSNFLLARVYSILARSRDGGATWQALTTPGSSFAQPTSLVFDPERPRQILVATSEGVWQSHDDAVHFERCDAGLPRRGTVVRLLADPARPGVFYAGVRRLSAAGIPVRGEVYRSRDGGTSWRRVGDRLPREFAGALAYDRQHDLLLAGTAGRGVFSLALGALD